MRTRYSRMGMGFIVVILALFLGCEHVTSPDKEFFFIGMLNSVKWQGDSDAKLLQDGRLVIWGLRTFKKKLDYGNGFFEILEDIVISVDFAGPGTYSIKPENAFIRRTWAGDMGCGLGASFGSAYDQLIIAKYDETQRIIEGTCRFRGKGDNGNSDFTFTNGWFRAKVR